MSDQKQVFHLETRNEVSILYSGTGVFLWILPSV